MSHAKLRARATRKRGSCRPRRKLKLCSPSIFTSTATSNPCSFSETRSLRSFSQSFSAQKRLHSDDNTSILATKQRGHDFNVVLTAGELGTALVAVVDLMRSHARVCDLKDAEKVSAQDRLWVATKDMQLQFEPGSFAAQIIEFAASAAPLPQAPAPAPVPRRNHLRLVR